MTRTDRSTNATPLDGQQHLVVLLSEGNPGAVTVLCKLLSVPHGGELLLDLDDMNIRGSQVWLAYKDFAGQNIEVLAEAIRRRAPEMVRAVNMEAMDGDWLAVTRGAVQDGRLVKGELR